MSIPTSILTPAIPLMVFLGAGRVCSGGPASRANLTVWQRRAELAKQACGGPKAIGCLVRALAHDQVLVRRAAARLLADIGPEAQSALVAVLGNSDYMVRWIALRALCRRPNTHAVSYLATAIKDESAVVRRAAVGRLANLEPRTAKVVELLTAATRDPCVSVRRIAGDALLRFGHQATRLRDRPDLDRAITVGHITRLPRNGWRFKLDPERQGHLKKWFAPGLDDSQWQTIAIEQAWQKAGHAYVGVAWYRRWIDLPTRPEHDAVEIHFLGVDESAWVWINGQYVGKHDIGPAGWNKPFHLEITRAVRWGARNHIAVRAMNTGHAGGIWRPVQIEPLQ